MDMQRICDMCEHCEENPAIDEYGICEQCINRCAVCNEPHIERELGDYMWGVHNKNPNHKACFICLLYNNTRNESNVCNRCRKWRIGEYVIDGEISMCGQIHEVYEDHIIVEMLPLTDKIPDRCHEYTYVDYWLDGIDRGDGMLRDLLITNSAW